MDELLDKYKDKFGECFPLMLTRGMSEEDIKDIIEACIENEYPYTADAENDY